MITTIPFKVEPSRLAAIIMKRWIRSHALLLVLPSLLLLIIGFAIDLRLVVLAIMLVFVIIPPIMMFVYFYHAMSPSAKYSILPHSLSISDNGIDIDYLPVEENKLPASPDHIAWDEINSADYDSDSYTITLSKSSYSIIYIPTSAFENQKNRQDIKHFLVEYLRK